MAAWLCHAPKVAAAPSPRMLIETTDISGISISPDGRYYSFRTERASIERNTYDSTWYVGEMGGGNPPIPVADGGIPIRVMGLPVPETPHWSVDGVWIYFRARFDGQVQVWRARRDGSRSEAVTRDPADVRAFELSPDGDRLIYEVGASREEIRRAEDAEYDSGIRIDGRVPVGQGLYRSGDINGVLSTERYSGSWVIRQGLLEDRPPELRSVDLTSMSAGPASGLDRAEFDANGPHALARTHGLMGFAARSGNGRIAYLKDEEGVARLHVSGGTGQADIVCSAPICAKGQVRAMAWRPGHDALIITVSDQARAQSIYEWNVATGSVRLIVRSVGLINGGRQIMGGETCGIGTDQAVCVVAGANTPPRLESVDLRTGARRVLLNPNTALVLNAGRPVETLTWRDAEGRDFTGRFFPPVGAVGPAPLVISYYTCPGYLRGGDAGDEWPLATLAGVGIAGLCVNMVSDADATTNYQIAESGIRAIVDHLAGEGRIDPKRVGMAGQSFGSEAVWWMAEKTGLLKTAAVTSSPVNPTYYWFHSIQPGFAETVEKRWRLGPPGETPEQWRLLSPVYQVENIHAAILMQMPEQEYLQTMETFGRLSMTATPVDLYAFPNEPHNKFMPRHMLAAYTRNVDWFRFWLQGFEDADPAKAEQYRLWRAMRDKQAESTDASRTKR